MPLTPEYCSQCGKTVETRRVDGHSRVVCPACDTVFYENPLPVAAALILNDRREVLLVKRAREPKKGMWCFPMGFAELGETIADAARRELREEAGIEAEVLRLVDADSYRSDHYGDLLIVTFEMSKTDGTEHAGDDAEDVRYFPLGQLPPLAFDSNRKALRICTAAHLENWEIEDSFVTLQSDEDKALLSDALVDLIEERAGDIATGWLGDVQSDRSTAGYHRAAPESLRMRAEQALSQFGRWFKGDEAAEEVRIFYYNVGSERARQGFKLHEVIGSLATLKKHIWQFARSHEVWKRPIDVYAALELNRRVATFFDKATYHTARGYEDHTNE